MGILVAGDSQYFPRFPEGCFPIFLPQIGRFVVFAPLVAASVCDVLVDNADADADTDADADAAEVPLRIPRRLSLSLLRFLLPLHVSEGTCWP